MNDNVGAYIENAIEALVALLDEIDGDPNLEDGWWRRTGLCQAKLACKFSRPIITIGMALGTYDVAGAHIQRTVEKV
jgi:hypothetical protein